MTIGKVTCIAAIVLLAACASRQPIAASSSSPVLSDNGGMIFLHGIDAHGKHIAAQRPPLRPSCAACHGSNGAGGIHLPSGAVSADLRHRALVTEQKHPYTLALLERAISKGIDNEGKPLNPVMPRWQLSARDLHDVAQYVLTQLH
ncbi:MAG: c-type cytochrome [Candidatus Eremiobacteraeota bacterium]|nr:c-type cytochrome [Candidatus Eremiobacteraeota bacterium]